MTKKNEEERNESSLAIIVPNTVRAAVVRDRSFIFLLDLPHITLHYS